MRPIWLVLLAACGDPEGRTPDAGAVSRSDDGRDPDAGLTLAAPDLALALPAHCPCPLGSYCELATQTCTRGCLGDDHCPAGQRCDKSIFFCAAICNSTTPCANHMACKPIVNGSICSGCERDFDDCNHNLGDGCETSLNTLTDCEECGKVSNQICIEDKDGDGYGVMATAKMQCRCDSFSIPTTRSYGEDCFDGDSQVRPGQSMFFDKARQGGSFDWDCDGKITVQYEFPGTPSCDANCDGVFWDKGTPTCGATGVLDLCFEDTFAGACAAAYNFQTVVQRCR